MKVWVWLAMMCVTGAQGQKAMVKEAHPTFEVAAIKLTAPENRNQGFHNDGNRVHIENETVKSMLMFAYGVHGKQLVGQPAWVDETAYDVRGVLDTAGEPNLKQLQEAVQSLLGDRFGLKLKREKRDLSYFALRVAGTPKIVKAANPEAAPDQSGNGGKNMVMKYTSNTMDEFIIGMNYFTDRPVVNETGLAGRWDFTLRWTPDGLKGDDAAADAAPGLFTAMKEQLGLKLEPAKGPVEVLVVDGVTRPSAN